MTDIHRQDSTHKTLNSAIISCGDHIDFVEKAKLVKFKQFQCWSYTSNSVGMLSILYLGKETKTIFHAVVGHDYIMMYPSNNDYYQPKVFVNFYLHIKNTMFKSAKLQTYPEFQEEKRKNETDF